MAQSLTIIGLLIDIAGVILLGWDFIWGRNALGRVNDRKINIENILKLEELAKKTSHMYDKFPNVDTSAPGYYDDLLHKNELYAKIKQGHQDEIAEIELKHSASVLNKGTLGLLFVVVGFMLQIAGVASA